MLRKRTTVYTAFSEYVIEGQISQGGNGTVFLVHDKREWHHEKAILLHDIICMANTCSDDGIIIIGVDERNNYAKYVFLDYLRTVNIKNLETERIITSYRQSFVGSTIKYQS